MNLSIDRVGLVVLVSITNRSPKHSAVRVDFSKRKLHGTEYALCKKVVGGWANPLWIVCTLFSVGGISINDQSTLVPFL